MEETGAKETVFRKKTLTLLEHIERVVTFSEIESKEKKLKLRKAFSKHLSFIARTLGISKAEARLFAHILNFSGDEAASQEALARSLKCGRIRLLRYMDCLEALEQKGLVFCIKNGSDFPPRSGYRIPHKIIQMIRQGKVFVPARHKNLSLEELFEHMEALYKTRKEEGISQKNMAAELQSLLNDSPQLDFCRVLKGLGINSVIFFVLLCLDLVIRDVDIFDLTEDYELKDLMGYEYTRFKRELRFGKNILFEKDLVEFAPNEGFRGTSEIQLTQTTREQYLSAFDLKETTIKKTAGFIPGVTITEKNLFFNKNEETQIRRLSGLLDRERFGAITRRLSERGMRTGFACLFSGPPGTGKTETAYQLARSTGRDLMPVEIAKTKSMWFGESEKSIKRVFDKYRAKLEQAEKSNNPAPILLFNEADGILGKRRETGHSLAQTENSMQNIILEEIENLRGILIATTNLSENMDAAFERRFLFKIEFAKPGPDVRSFIWQSLIPNLESDDYRLLASRFDFSGGQIENIARKCAVESVLAGVEPEIEKILVFCREELNGKREARIGFIQDEEHCIAVQNTPGASGSGQ
jgi:hypothetical protein